MTAIISPEGRHVVPPLTEGEGVLIADLDLALIVKRKRMMDSVGHYARPELMSVLLDHRPAVPMHARALCFSSHRFPPKEDHEPADRTLINELQSYGLRLADPKAGVESRRGGAGPSDHKALTIDGVTVMAPVHTAPAFESPYVVEKPDAARARATSYAMARRSPKFAFPTRPRFYDLKTAGRHPLFAHRDAARPRRPRYHGPADLHPLSEPHEDLPVLRHRPVACGGQDRRAQDARSACRSRSRGGRTRRRQAHGDDHRHAARPRSRRGDPVRERGGRESRRRSADPGAMRAA